MQDKRFGYFDDDNREYVITDPKTPWPWINYLGNEDFFSLISNTAGGYSFYKDAKFRRITRYRYNNVPMDNGGRYFYINEGGNVWSPTWKPCKTALDSYECRHGMSYTRITGSKDGIEASLLFFVPLKTWGEVQKLTLRNTSAKVRKLKLFSFAEWCLWNAATDMENFQRNFSTGEVEVDGSVIYHKTEYKERRNHYAFYSVNTPVDGFDTDRETFVGLYNEFADPERVVEGRPGNSIAHGWSPIASHYLEVELQPGESRDFIFLLGYVENKQEAKFEEREESLHEAFKQSVPSSPIINKVKAKAMISAFDTTAKVDAAFAELKAYWDRLLDIYVVKTDEEKLDRMVNIWNQYQCMITFNMSRSASFFESGIGRGMGFRDSNQDLVGFVHQIPERARERIIDIASTQFPDGGCYHQYQPLTKRGNNDIGGGFNDDPMWLIFGTVAYIKESGDFSILDEPVPFDNKEGSEVSLFEHLRVSFNHVIENLGPHMLPLIGRADWNDCLNLNCFSEHPGESFQITGPSEGPVAESVFIAGMFVKYGREYADLCGHRGLPDEAADARAAIAQVEQAALTAGWDGAWFRRAYDAFGKPVGSKECDEGQIFIEPQGMCVMAGIGKETGQAEQALKSVEERLDTKYGVVLLQPAYTTYRLNLGEISSYPPGYKENAGIFCHNNPWISCAETVLGHGDRAFEVYRKTCPAYIEDISDIHRTEPYVYSQMVAGKDAPTFGEAKNSWLTGTAAWTFCNVSQYILGVQPTLDGLKIDPCIPHTLPGFTVTRRYRGAVYHIRVENPAAVQNGVKRVTVNGKTIEGNVLPLAPAGETVEVTVVMG